MRHVFIVGSKGIPGAYGGYETFVDTKLLPLPEKLFFVPVLPKLRLILFLLLPKMRLWLKNLLRHSAECIISKMFSVNLLKTGRSNHTAVRSMRQVQIKLLPVRSLLLPVVLRDSVTVSLRSLQNRGQISLSLT